MAVGEVNGERVFAAVGVRGEPVKERDEARAAAADGRGQCRVAVQSRGAVERGVGEKKIAENVRIRAEDGADFPEESRELIAADRAAGIDADEDADALAFERFEIKAATDEAAIEAGEIGGRLHEETPEPRAPVEPAGFEGAEFAGEAGGRGAAERAGDGFRALHRGAPVAFELHAADFGEARLAVVGGAGRGVEEVGHGERRQLRDVALEQLVHFLGAELREPIVTHAARGQRAAGLREDHRVDDDVGGDIPELRLAHAAARAVAERGVKHFVEEQPVLLGGRERRPEIGVHVNGDPIGRGGRHGARDLVAGEERERGKERLMHAQPQQRGAERRLAHFRGHDGGVAHPAMSFW